MIQFVSRTVRWAVDRPDGGETRGNGHRLGRLLTTPGKKGSGGGHGEDLARGRIWT